jgi:hypothetical protein
MTDIPKNANGLRIVVHETKPVAQIHMFIDGKYTHWVEYDISQMKHLAEVACEKLQEMMEKKDGLS